MLPFPKRALKSEELELDEDDLVEVVSVCPESADDTQQFHDAPTTARISLAELDSARESARALFARRPFDSGHEDDVAGEVLASINKESQRVSVRSITPSTVPVPPSRPSRSSVSGVRAVSVGSVPGVFPPPPRVPLFARAAVDHVAPTHLRAPSLPHFGGQSLAPIVAPAKSESIILVRERRPLGWIVATALVSGALAVLATRLLSMPSAPPQTVAAPPAVVTAAAPPPAIASAPALVVVPAPAPAAPPSAMQFADGVSIPAPAASVPKKPKKRIKSAAPPMTPDSNYSLSSTASAAVVPAPPPAAATPAPTERDLLSQQLKATK